VYKKKRTKERKKIDKVFEPKKQKENYYFYNKRKK
jgi:hypothetical protein